MNLSKLDCQVTHCPALEEMNITVSLAAVSNTIQPSTSTSIQEKDFVQRNIQFLPQSCSHGIISTAP